MSERIWIEKSYFEGLSHEELAQCAYELSQDCDRLRRELDKVNGVIR